MIQYLCASFVGDGLKRISPKFMYNLMAKSRMHSFAKCKNENSLPWNYLVTEQVL
jgi:hypothetical protein